ncbi:hypothetical protein BFR04_10145 [Gaetbulibacter sp. 4G1]|nr:helix-turn-helix transcriptional regulator [Gaetbulibacter sp. 4G1]PIA77779.1 hypothetical protein BFR04_10145 [Gaetbulibacter sp. 4G1]
MQYAPSKNLSNFIKHYLIFDVPSSGQKQFRHFSNGHNGLVFTLKKKEFVSLNSKTTLPETFIFGQISENQDFGINGATSIIIVLFQPLGFFGLTGIPANNYINDFEDSYLIFGKEILELKDCLQSSTNSSEAINYLNSYFTKKLKISKYILDPFLMNTIQLAYKEKGNVSVNELCSQLGVKERKMQRMFSKQIGIAPKKFISNIKLHYFLSLLRNQSGLSSLTNLSLQAGYYDQAHLIKEFKKTVGFVPSKYLNIPRLAVNLIEI